MNQLRSDWRRREYKGNAIRKQDSRQIFIVGELAWVDFTEKPADDAPIACVVSRNLESRL